MMRRLLFITLCVSLTLALAAVALAGSRDPRLRRRPADVKLAKTLILKARDLPSGFVDKGKQKDSGPTPNLPCAEPNLHALVMTADVSSHDFVRSGTGTYAEATSEATFFSRSPQAHKAVTVITSRKIGRCLKKFVIKDVTKSTHGLLKVLSVRLVPLSETVRDLHTRIWDLFLTFKVRGLTFRDELALAYFRRGRVVDMVMLNSVGGLSEQEARDISQALVLRLERLPRSAVR